MQEYARSWQEFQEFLHWVSFYQFYRHFNANQRQSRYKLQFSVIFSNVCIMVIT